MKTLHDLTIFDDRISESKNQLLKEKKIFANSQIPGLYKNLFEGYSLLEDIEALKRATFIQWYSVIEPNENSGMGEMNTQIEKKNIIKINQLIKNNLIDEEFLFFLNHYYNIGDWYFDSLELSPIFKSRTQLQLDYKNFEGRGVMGEYWKQILEI